MIRKIGVALAIAAGALAATGVAAPANAAGGYDIDFGEFVVWRDANFTGPAFDYDAVNTPQYGQLDSVNTGPNTANNGAFRTLSGGVYVYSHVNDAVSSLANYDLTDYIRAWTGASYDGTYFQVLPYGYTSGTSLSWSYSSLGSFDNQLSSHQIAGSPTP